MTSLTDGSAGETPQGAASHAKDSLVDQWQQALAGDPHAQAQWSTEKGGQWAWQSDGVLVKSSGTEWSSLGWQRFDASALRDLQNFVIELTVSGNADAAGISFGDFKDFLADLGSNGGHHRLQFEVDVDAGTWAFRVDGQLHNRRWWDSDVNSIDDLLGGMLLLKARAVKQVLFQDLAIHVLQSSCRLSVIMTSYRFLQRLRVTLRNWCHQTLPSGAYEVLVVNPNSPDGTHEHLAAVARSYPHVRVRELAIEPGLTKNKGAMINRAVKASNGDWIWLTDADCLFPLTSAETALNHIIGQGQNLFFGQRWFLSSGQTDALLAGRSDGMGDFENLYLNVSPRAPDSDPWGYTQIVHRSVLERVPYRENFEHYAHSDSLFIQDCARQGIFPKQIEGLFCLHLDHPFAWYGTDVFL